MNAAAMGLIYGNAIRTNLQYHSYSDRYICWAKGQMRYVLGDVVTGFVVGFPSANGGYTRPQDRASSCPDPPAVCNAITAYYNPSVGSLCCRIYVSFLRLYRFSSVVRSTLFRPWSGLSRT